MLIVVLEEEPEQPGILLLRYKSYRHQDYSLCFYDILYIIINILPRCMERSRSDGVSVEVPSQYCDPAEKPIEEEACHLFCSNECVLSEWSSWTSCSHTVIKIVC